MTAMMPRMTTTPTKQRHKKQGCLLVVDREAQYDVTGGFQNPYIHVESQFDVTQRVKYLLAP